MIIGFNNDRERNSAFLHFIAVNNNIQQHSTSSTLDNSEPDSKSFTVFARKQNVSVFSFYFTYFNEKESSVEPKHRLIATSFSPSKRIIDLYHMILIYESTMPRTVLCGRFVS